MIKSRSKIRLVELKIMIQLPIDFTVIELKATYPKFQRTLRSRPMKHVHLQKPHTFYPYLKQGPSLADFAFLR